jgi:hypothetical protein
MIKFIFILCHYLYEVEKRIGGVEVVKRSWYPFLVSVVFEKDLDLVLGKCVGKWFCIDDFYMLCEVELVDDWRIELWLLLLCKFCLIIIKQLRILSFYIYLNIRILNLFLHLLYRNCNRMQLNSLPLINKLALNFIRFENRRVPFIIHLIRVLVFVYVDIDMPYLLGFLPGAW